MFEGMNNSITSESSVGTYLIMPSHYPFNSFHTVGLGIQPLKTENIIGDEIAYISSV